MRFRSVATLSGGRWMPSSRSTRRASSETSAPSRAYGAMPPDSTLIAIGERRARASICFSSASAMTLRLVLA